MNASPHPLRTVVRWEMSPTGGHVVLFSCGHRADFGRGEQPRFEAYPCVGCPKDEAAAVKAVA